jgi:hypothetical protein
MLACGADGVGVPSHGWRAATPCSPAVALGLAALVLWPLPALAGPPYVTDDPEPVAYRHWEFYLATMPDFTRAGATGTAPHFEINYGAIPNVQLHTIVPLAYARPSGGPSNYGPGDIELGMKVRFVQEGERLPMIGTFPMLEVPTGDAGRGLGTGHLHGLVPLWLQKSVGPWTTYGGAGYWWNPGEGNRSYWYVGWLLQCRVAEWASPGAEIYYTTPDQVGGDHNLRFNLGLVLDITEHHHVLSSGGRSIVGEHAFQGYLAYQLTL